MITLAHTYTVAQVAGRWHVSPDTVRRLIASGQLRGICVSTDRRSKKPRFVVHEADLAAFELARGSGKQERHRRGQHRRPEGTRSFCDEFAASRR